MNIKREITKELHRAARRRFPRRRVIIKYIDETWEGDLVDMQAYTKFNKGFSFMLTLIDTFSKQAFAHPLKNKSASEVTKAMEKVFLTSKRSPINFHTDQGKEFYNLKFQNLMKKYNINHYSTFSSIKASIVERFNRTLKSRMWKEFSYRGSYKWIDILDDLIFEYNNTVHRTIQMKPNEVNNTTQKIIRDKHIFQMNDFKSLRKPKFRVNDMVRISKYKHVFEKGYTPNWTTELFKIKNVKNTDPVTYLLTDYMENEIKGSFYEYELNKTNFPDKYLVEKVIKKKSNGDSYVKWLGFSPEHNSCIRCILISLIK